MRVLPVRSEVQVSCNLRIILHHAPELHFRNPRLEIDTVRWVVGHPVDEPHIIQRLRRIQGEVECPERKERTYEYRSTGIIMNLEDQLRGMRTYLFAMY